MHPTDEYLQCLNPTPGPCDNCARMKYPCRITAHRKQKPIYYASDEQFQWMIAIIQHFLPDINLELEGLKAAGAKLGIAVPVPPVAGQTPTLSLPPSLEAPQPQQSDSTSAKSDVMSERSPSLEHSEFEEEEEEEDKEDAIRTDDILANANSQLDEQSPAEVSTELKNRKAEYSIQFDI